MDRRIFPKQHVLACKTVKCDLYPPVVVYPPNTRLEDQILSRSRSLSPVPELPPRQTKLNPNYKYALRIKTASSLSVQANVSTTSTTGYTATKIDIQVDYYKTFGPEPCNVTCTQCNHTGLTEIDFVTDEPTNSLLGLFSCFTPHTYVNLNIIHHCKNCNQMLAVYNPSRQ